MLDWLARPWPWYIAGPLLGLFVPLLLLVGNKAFGISGSFRHLCAATIGRSGGRAYDWKRTGAWKIAFAAGIVAGGYVAGALLASPDPVAISASTRADLAALGLGDFSGLHPREIFSVDGLFSLRGVIMIVAGGFLVGFGTSYAGGCTSGHGLTGLASFQLASLIAVIGFFAGGIFCTFVILPAVF